MTTDKKLQDLANENQRLLAENTQFKDFVIRVASMKTYGEWIDEFGTTSNLKETAILLLGGYQAPEAIAPKPDLSFTAHDDATSNGCKMCGNEYKSLNAEGYCSSCWTVWKS